MLVSNIVGGVLFVLVPFIVKNKLHESAAGLGLLYSCGAVGAIGGSVLLSQLTLPRRHIAAMYALWSTAALASVGYAFVGQLWQALLVASVVGFGITSGNVIWGALVGLLVPREMIGRVTSVDWLFTLGLIPLAYAFVGPVSNAIGVSETLIAAGILGAVLPVCFLLLVPGIRDTERSRLVPSPGGLGAG